MAHGDLWRETISTVGLDEIKDEDLVMAGRSRWLVRLGPPGSSLGCIPDAAPATTEQMTGAEAVEAREYRLRGKNVFGPDGRVARFENIRSAAIAADWLNSGVYDPGKLEWKKTDKEPADRPSPSPENQPPPDRKTDHEAHAAYGIPARIMETLDLMNRSIDSPTCPPPAPGPEIPPPLPPEPIPACVQVALDVLAIGPNRKFTTVADDAAADLLAAYLRQFVLDTAKDQPEAPSPQQADDAARDAAEAHKHLRNLLHVGTVNLSGWNGLLAVQQARDYLANGPDAPSATDAPPEQSTWRTSAPDSRPIPGGRG